MLYEDPFKLPVEGVFSGKRYPLMVRTEKNLADTENITIQPATTLCIIAAITAKDVATGNTYTWAQGIGYPPPGNGAWNNQPYITPGTGNLQLTIAIENLGTVSGTATITVTPSSGSPQTYTMATGVATVLNGPTLTFTMPSSAMTITVKVTP